MTGLAGVIRGIPKVTFRTQLVAIIDKMIIDDTCYIATCLTIGGRGVTSGTGLVTTHTKKSSDFFELATWTSCGAGIQVDAFVIVSGSPSVYPAFGAFSQPSSKT